MNWPHPITLAAGISILAGCGGGTVNVPGVDAAPDVDAGLSVEGGSDAGSDASSFDVGKLPGLVLWLDGAKGVTVDGSGNVSKWADQSGKSNDAVQSISVLQPTLVASAIAGKPAVHFKPAGSTGPHLTVADTATLRLGSGDFYITAVAARASNNSALGCVLSKQNVASPFAGYALYLNLSASHAGGQLDANTNVLSTGGPYGDGVAREFEFVRLAGAATFRVNGVMEGNLPATAVDSDGVGMPLSIGGVSPNGLHGLVGDLAELVVVKGSISSTDMAAVEAYLKGKYGL